MRGQTSMEMLLVAVIVISVAVYLMNFYNDNTKDTIAFAVVRGDVDQALNLAKFAGCDGQLEKIEQDGNKFKVYVSNCEDYINPDRIEQDIYSALGCPPESLGCKGKEYAVEII